MRIISNEELLCVAGTDGGTGKKLEVREVYTAMGDLAGYETVEVPDKSDHVVQISSPKMTEMERKIYDFLLVCQLANANGISGVIGTITGDQTANKVDIKVAAESPIIKTDTTVGSTKTSSANTYTMQCPKP